MSEPSAFGFGQFVPGFDFLQNLSKTASAAQPSAAGGMPGMASWVAPTLSIEDIDKRIQELKSVLFWLEQNTTALKATIQAMEVQKMTLTTLQSMNVNMADLAKAFTAKPPVSEPAQAAPSGTASAAKSSLFSPKPESQAVPPQSAPSEAPKEEASPASEAKTTASASEPAVDPMQWWGALTQQFQGIAAAALKDVAGEAMKAGMRAKNATAKAPRKPGASSATARGQGAKPSSAKPAKPAVTAKSVRPVSVKKSAAKPATRAARKTALK
ncbi:PhaM family polyhydroxyalkanoate granule multifunctional regulatory protein [Limnohabitans sp. Rim8]|uniref:PhaM family polyhydroxyalkanoate granule multifunctional regulatory protein n=1 Tax=Limnohabitans sp. Rim8 TaxID=1100718 RepID=UPI002626647C|nr:PhaM family polyhydroxyalkanoate granule multifunctional regulatory protein [Limnohabitans sp. Rim8]